MNGYDVMAKILKAEGVEYLIAFPYQTLIEAASKVGITPIICRQERAGVNRARRGECLWRRGPGVCRFYPDFAPARWRAT